MNFLKTLLLALALSLPLYAVAGEPVNINTADAAAIAEYRQKNGPFKSADELVNVKGIGLKTVEKNRDLIRTGGAAPAKPATP